MSDDEETVAVDRKRERRDSQRKLEKDEPGAKLKKKTRVLVEVKILQHVKRNGSVLLHYFHIVWYIFPII